ncbi:hypothetical protein AB0B78_19070 [Streptomyces sp. NPDC040724]|uniref:hypothetical protein n=1 Tax=Streptomyces sp. NPDC040724 TaxID=3155612 RepID=UPI003411AB63
MAGAAGCTGGNGGGGGASTAEPKPSVPPPPPLVITQAEAEKVFSRFEWERRTPAVWKDTDGAAKVATGPLMTEWRADAAVHAVWKGPQHVVSGLVNPVFAIPAERDQPSYPRSFVTLSKANGGESGPATAVHYFVQEAPGGEWKAAVETWVATAASVPLVSENVLYAPTAVQVRKDPVAAVSRNVDAAVLSPTAATDREACGRFADYLSFTTPDEPETAPFAPGPLTDGVVGKLGEKAQEPKLKGLVTYAFEHEVTGPELPVLKLDDGASLVACPLLREERAKGKNATVSFSFGNSSQQGALLDAKGKWWRSSNAKLSLTALIELPSADTPGPAQLVACNCAEPQLLEVTGKPAD